MKSKGKIEERIKKLEVALDVFMEKAEVSIRNEGYAQIEREIKALKWVLGKKRYCVARTRTEIAVDKTIRSILRKPSS